MAKLSVVLQPPLDQFATGFSGRLEVDGETVLDALHAAVALAPSLAMSLFDGDSLSPFVHVFYNSAYVPAGECANHVTGSGEICLLTSIRGG